MAKDNDTFINGAAHAYHLIGNPHSGVLPIALWQIEQAGFLTTIQDGGRRGYQQYGMPVAGAMDLESYELGQRLVGNPLQVGALECTVMGPTFTVQEPCVVAFTGALMHPTINDIPAPMNEALRLQTGDVVACQFATSGLRMYISVRGGLQVPIINDSVATHVKSKLGGYGGRRLQAGDVLVLGDERLQATHLNRWALPNYTVPATYEPPMVRRTKQAVRIVLGPQADRFTEDSFTTLTAEGYEITPASDRMGYRLAGQALTHISGADIISDGAVFGSIQVPADGQPIILMAERQTTGGYTKVATVITPDLPILAQMGPGEIIHFEIVTIEEAQAIYKAYMEQFI
ncbi:biotin-dependent carboxyltransferase family protein [Veillonella sp. R32]|uniref:5-oxoprolinase subunit C family protein n=1 Tax=Veillonella sp. R32 TaxID=2021312 RepID=UPI001389CE83|nr:biotin-dependent carboxyltransferase family protein [Veillonella sp. R32]KAF1683111.1 carboxylase [Veillonella sp. R32]